MGEYSDVLKRLIVFRKNIGFTQSEIASKLGIPQEQYSCIENGKSKLTYPNMLVLREYGADIDYLITGRNYDDLCKNVREELHIPAKNEEHMLRMVMYLFCIASEKNNTSTDSLIKYFSDNWNDFTMLRYIRYIKKYSQITMADVLGVGIKKYRELEKEYRYPDAELLHRLYGMTGYQPTLFLDCCNRQLTIVSTHWNEMPESEKKRVKGVIGQMRDIVDVMS